MNVAFAMKKCVKQQVGFGLLAALVCGCSAWATDRTLPSPAEQQHIEADCAPFLAQSGVRRAVQMSRVLVQSQGMQLIVQGCPFVRVSAGTMQQVIDVRVFVVDSETAANFVRGPLADGEEVDMGPVQLSKSGTDVAVVVEEDEDISPDVQFNRQWLAQLMQARGLQPIHGHWWAFAPVPTSK